MERDEGAAQSRAPQPAAPAKCGQGPLDDGQAEAVAGDLAVLAATTWAGLLQVALMLENGRGVARDQGRASALYRRVCASGSSAACDAATRLEVGRNAVAPRSSGRSKTAPRSGFG
jgi:TPR repeat protein